MNHRRYRRFPPRKYDRSLTPSQSQMATPTISLKLLVDTKSNKVAYAEAGKDFVDFLFGLLQLPIGTILSLLVGRGMSGSGSLGKIYDSVTTLEKEFLQSDQTRKSLLSPQPATESSTKVAATPLLKQLAYPNQGSGYSSYSSPSPFCSYPNQGSGYSSYSSPSPFYSYSSPSPFCSSKDVVVEGHVKGVVTYLVMDDLVVKPMSTISSITVLNNMRVKDFGTLEEKTVEVDVDNALKLLKASFESTTVLSDVFLPKVQIPTSGEGETNSTII